MLRVYVLQHTAVVYFDDNGLDEPQFWGLVCVHAAGWISRDELTEPHCEYTLPVASVSLALIVSLYVYRGFSSRRCRGLLSCWGHPRRCHLVFTLPCLPTMPCWAAGGGISQQCEGRAVIFFLLLLDLFCAGVWLMWCFLVFFSVTARVKKTR